MEKPMKTNDTLSPRRMGGRPGVRNKAATAGARIQTRTRQARPTARLGEEDARISSSERSGLWTSAAARTTRAKYARNSTTRLATAISSDATGANNREMVAV